MRTRDETDREGWTSAVHVNKWLTSFALAILPISAIAIDPAAYYRQPVRIVNQSKVELAPLVTWWSNAVFLGDSYLWQKKIDAHIRARPLSGWVRIRGTNMQGSASGWTLEALIESRPGQVERKKIFLLHPPYKEKARFDWIQKRILELDQDSKLASRSASRSQSAYQYNHDQAEDLRSYRTLLPDRYGNEYATSIASGQEQRFAQAANASLNSAQRSRQISADDQREINRLTGELVRTFPNSKIYSIDYFGFPTGQFTPYGVPIYDLGEFLQ